MGDEAYKGNTREPRKSTTSPRGYCINCGVPKKVVPKRKSYCKPRPPKTCECGTVPILTYDAPNHETFIACMVCEREGERIDCTEYANPESQAKIGWAAGRLSRSGWRIA